jgi:hypothetical protein
MIAGPLKNNIQLSVIILLVICIGLWINTLVFSPSYLPDVSYDEHILYYFIFNHKLSFIATQIIACIVILLGAFFVNFMAVQQEITSKTNFLPSFFYILLAFSATAKNSLEPILVANLFVMASLYFIINSYRREEALPDFFNAGLCMGLASFFYIDYLIIFPVLYIATLILRAFNWREWVVSFLGLIAPLFIYMCLCYLANGDIFIFYNMMKDAINQLQLPVISEFYIGFLIVSILLFVFALFHYFSKGFGSKVKTQKTKYIMFWLLGLCVLMAFFEQLPDMLLLSSIIPLSVILGDYIAEIKQLKIANTLLVLFMGTFVVVYFYALGII